MAGQSLLWFGATGMATNQNGPAALGPTNQRALEDFDRLPDSAEVRLPVVAALLGISTVTVWRWSASGRLPKPTRRGGVTTWRVGALRRLPSET
jgi:predicted DNA-binding transcriptional regulator AlpA